MKIAILTRHNCYSKFGGDTHQIQMYQRIWKAAGHDVDIVNSPNFGDRYDAYIVTNIDRSLECLTYLGELERRDLLAKTFILSIHHDLGHIRQFERRKDAGLLLNSLSRFSNSTKEKVKNFARSLRSPYYAGRSFKILFQDMEAAYRSFIERTTIIVIADGEVPSIERDYGVEVARVISARNGINVPSARPRSWADRSIDVLISGRIEQRKNSLAVAKMLSMQPMLKCTFVGAINVNAKHYSEAFKKVILDSPNLSYIGSVAPSAMTELYQDSKIHFSGSWFEVASLVDLEAYANGCKVISSANGNTRDYLGSRIAYATPSDLASSSQILSGLLDSEPDVEEQNAFMATTFTWETVSMKLLNDITTTLAGVS